NTKLSDIFNGNGTEWRNISISRMPRLEESITIIMCDPYNYSNYDYSNYDYTFDYNYEYHEPKIEESIKEPIKEQQLIEITGNSFQLTHKPNYAMYDNDSLLQFVKD